MSKILEFKMSDKFIRANSTWDGGILQSSHCIRKAAVRRREHFRERAEIPNRVISTVRTLWG